VVTLDYSEGWQEYAGTDISGFIDGQEATGIGRVLSLPTGTGGAVGLSLEIDTTEDDVGITAGALGSVTYSPGLAQRLSTLVADATASTTGAVSTATDGANAEVKRYQAAIDAWDDRLETYRQSLTRQFTAMETALQKLKSSMSSITNMVNALSAASTSGSSGASS
jgi:flagellar hook-associated protein 2